MGCGVIVVASVAAEFVIAIVHPSYDSPWQRWGSAIADALIALGIVGEVAFGMWNNRIQTELRARSNQRLGEANERAAKADLARAELEAKLLPRTLTKGQWNFIQELKGKFEEISIAFEVDVETEWFANQIRDAFFAAGIRVGMFPRAPEVHGFGILIVEPRGFDGAQPRTVGPLIELFTKGDILPPLAIIGKAPNDILRSISFSQPEMRPPPDTPMIIVGGRFVLPPPHLERAAKAAKAAMDAMDKQNKPPPRDSSI
jgi:hypothetical protein